jgi:hypothetical protein
MELRVRAMGRCGIASDRAATDKSVYGIKSEGPCWAVDARVENSNSRQLREGSIARYWSTHQQAEADAALIARGLLFYKDTGRRYMDPVITAAEAYWR